MLIGRSGNFVEELKSASQLVQYVAPAIERQLNPPMLLVAAARGGALASWFC
jgi:hypothetical protein